MLKEWATRQFMRGLRSSWPSPNVTFPLGRHGRLGNQLFQIAGTYAIAARLGRRVVLRNDWPYRRYFSMPSDWFAGRLDVMRCTVKAEWYYIEQLGSDWTVYLQDLSLWDGRETEIRRLLQPSRHALDAVAERYPELLELPSTTSVHVRRGDYLAEHALHQPCPTEYYEFAAEEVLSKAKTTRFIVFSDDIEWCRRNLRLPDPLYAVGNPDWLDLTLMTHCDHHICANSTFSWWGAFLSDDLRPIVPWIQGVVPDEFRRVHPPGWQVVEI